MRMSTSGHNQRQVAATVDRAICEDLIVDTCVPSSGQKNLFGLTSWHPMITYFLRIVLLIQY